MISHCELLDLLQYDPITGVFTWRKSIAQRARQGCTAGYIGCRGYVSMQIKGTQYLAHRLAWFYTTGDWPAGQIDHKNHSRADNRLLNLREADQAINNQNLSRSKVNTSGFTGVSWDRARNKWYACIRVDKKSVSLGRHVNIQDAIAARAAANIKYGFHPNHGK